MVQGVFSISFASGSPSAKRRPSAAISPLNCFLGGVENLLVQVACRDVLSRSPRFHPLVFVGSSGTGKSMLARGLAGQWESERHSPTLVLSGADFARAYAHAVDTDSLTEFRQRLERPLRLVIEDVQQIAHKEPAQHELERLIDAQGDCDGQLVATSHQLPCQIDGLSLALASRLSGGLTVPVAPPGAEARAEILRRLAAAYQVHLPEAVVELLAGGDPPPFPTAPQLQHALSQLQATAQDTGDEISTATASQLLQAVGARGEPTLRTICSLTARQFCLRSADLRGPSRRQSISQARGIAMLLSRRLTKKSLEQIGQHFGNRDHTTVIHGCRKSEHRMAQDPALREAYESLARQLSS